MLWSKGDRVIVKVGKHAGRRGTINMLASDEFAAYFGLKAPQVRVALDGEPGQIATGPGALAHGGRGGVPFNVDPEDLEAVP